MAKIKLHATSFAKPFGGSIGPWFYNLWPSGSDKSDSGTQVDKAMPPLRIAAGFGNTLAEKLKVIPNFSNYVGDVDGTRDPIYQAIFHDFLLTRSLSNNSNDASKSREPGNPSATPSKPQVGYPFFKNWRNVGKALTDTDYDPLAVDDDVVANSYIRDLEIAAIAPNQFDLTYYSIDPDFYHNYFKNKLDNNGPDRTLNKFKDLTSGFSNVIAQPDYGYSRALFNRGSIPEDYSVRHQLAVVEQIFKYDGSSTGMDQLKVTGLKNASSVIQKYFSFIPRFQGSLLTGWTYKDLVSQDGFTQFPNAASGTKMIFGECSAPFASTGTPKYGTMVTDVISAGLPPAPGNCVTGGRTGYSVKIVNPASINEPQGDIGGVGTGGAGIQNPIPTDFFDFN